MMHGQQRDLELEVISSQKGHEKLCHDGYKEGDADLLAVFAEKKFLCTASLSTDLGVSSLNILICVLACHNKLPSQPGLCMPSGFHFSFPNS